MKIINVYFNSVTKVQIGHLTVEDDQSIEEQIQEWIKQGYARVHYMNNSIYIYVPWTNIIYCQYASREDANRDVENP